MYNVAGTHLLKFNTDVDEELYISGLEATAGNEQWRLELGTDPFMVFGGAAADRVGTNELTVVGSGEFTTGLTVGGVPVRTADWDGDIADIDLDGGTDIGADLADADLILVDDGGAGTNRKSALSRVWTYISGKLASFNLTGLSSGAATEGQVPVADGAGAIAWEDPTGAGTGLTWNAADYGILPDGNNCVTAIHALLDVIAGELTGDEAMFQAGYIFFPPGAYNCTGGLIIDERVRLVCTSPGAAVLYTNSDEALIQFKSPTEADGGVLYNAGMINVWLECRAASITSSSVGLDIGVSRQAYFGNVLTAGFFEHFRIRGALNPCTFDNCGILANEGTVSTDGGGYGIRVMAAITNSGGATAVLDAGDSVYTVMPTAVYFNNFVGRFANGEVAQGIRIESADGLYFNGGLIHQANDSLVVVDQSHASRAVGNVRFSSMFFDGEATREEIILDIKAPGMTGTPAAPNIDLTFADCKFNGPGSAETGARLIKCASKWVKTLTIDGGYGDKCSGTDWIEITAGGGTFRLLNTEIRNQSGETPASFVKLGHPSSAADFFDHVIIQGNTFRQLAASDTPPDANIRVTGYVNDVVIGGNAYVPHNGVNGDGLLYDDKTAGNVFGSALSAGNMQLGTDGTRIAAAVPGQGTLLFAAANQPLLKLVGEETDEVVGYMETPAGHTGKAFAVQDSNGNRLLDVGHLGDVRFQGSNPSFEIDRNLASFPERERFRFTRGTTGSLIYLFLSSSGSTRAYEIVRDDDGATEHKFMLATSATTWQTVLSLKASGINMPLLPTSDPAVAGDLWVDASAGYVIKQSQG
jgi:hypothetical protein